MKVLQIVPAIPPRGGSPSVIIKGLAGALTRAGIQATVFTTNADGDSRLDVPLGQPVECEGAQLIYYNVRPKGNYAFSPDLALALWRQVSAFDLVHIHWLYNFAPLAGALLTHMRGVPYIVQPHGSLDPVMLRRNRRWVKKVYLRSMGRLQFNRASAVIFTSEQERKLAAHADISAPTFVVPIGLDLAEYSKLPESGEFRSQYPQLKDKRLVLFLSRLAWQKGLDLLVKSFRIVASRNPDAHLLIVGPDSEGYGNQVKRWVAEEGLDSRITFVGPLYGRMKLAVFVDSEVFVLASYMENFGAVVTEALACRKPVVISNRVNIADEIAASEAGVVVDCSADSVADGINQVLDNPDLAKRLGENGYELVRRKFTWDAALQQLVPIYRDLAG